MQLALRDKLIELTFQQDLKNKHLFRFTKLTNGLIISCNVYLYPTNVIGIDIWNNDDRTVFIDRLNIDSLENLTTLLILLKICNQKV